MHFSVKIYLTSDGTCVTIEHEQVLHRDLNNSEIRYKKLCIFLARGAYAPYAPCMSTPLDRPRCSLCELTVGFYPLL